MISIVIPVYNEAELIEQRLLQLKHQLSNQNFVKEVIVVDGGSTDKTCEIASSLAFIKLITTEKGRAKQMNAGARIASQNILYFLHIDSTPPKDFDLFIVEKINQNKLAGCFCMRFKSKHPWLVLMSWLTKINHPACRGGDQSLYITKEIFRKIGGYNEAYNIYEDNILIGELYKQNQFSIIQKWITTSARRYKNVGVFKLQMIYLTIYFKKWRGHHPDELYAYFEKKLKDKS
jgi:rSAM/selenodomain-associated transferase 2